MKFKQKTMYEIRCWEDGKIYSRLMSNKLKCYKKANRLVKRLKQLKIDAFKAKIVITIPTK